MGYWNRGWNRVGWSKPDPTTEVNVPGNAPRAAPIIVVIMMALGLYFIVQNTIVDHNQGIKEAVKDPTKIAYVLMNDYEIMADKAFQCLDSHIYTRGYEKELLETVLEKTDVDYTGTFAEVMYELEGRAAKYGIIFVHYISNVTGIDFIKRWIHHISPQNSIGEHCINYFEVDKDGFHGSKILYGRNTIYFLSERERIEMSRTYNMPNFVENYMFYSQFGVNAFHQLIQSNVRTTHIEFNNKFQEFSYKDTEQKYDISESVHREMSEIYGQVFGLLSVVKSNPEKSHEFIHVVANTAIKQGEQAKSLETIINDKYNGEVLANLHVLLKDKKVDLAGIGFTEIHNIAMDGARHLERKILSDKTDRRYLGDYEGIKYRNNAPAEIVKYDTENAVHFDEAGIRKMINLVAKEKDYPRWTPRREYINGLVTQGDIVRAGIMMGKGTYDKPDGKRHSDQLMRSLKRGSAEINDY